MDHEENLAALRREGDRFRKSVAAVGLDTPVVSCPEWHVRDLIWHLSEVHYFWGTVVAERATTPEAVERIDQVPDDRLLATYDTMFTRLVDTLTTTEPSTAVWSWSAQHDVAFVIRRMAQETAVHRWDADQAADRAADRAVDIEAMLASDGIDEFLEHFLSAADGGEPLGGSVHIHCVDTAGEWLIRPSGEEFEVTREHAKGDCALRGNASDLLLALWRRVGPERLDIVGDADLGRRFLASSGLE